MGRVFLGHWQGENVAIKACNTASVAFSEAEFRYELALMSTLSHENLLSCLAADVTGSTYFMLLPFQGTTNLDLHFHLHFHFHLHHRRHSN